MGEADRIDLNALAAKLAPSEIQEVADFIAWKVAKHEAALRAALEWHESLPLEDEAISSEEDAAAAAARTELASGAKTIALEDLARELDL